MARAGTRWVRAARVSMAAVVVALLPADAFAVLMLSNRAVPVPVSTAVQRYRQHSATGATGATPTSVVVNSGSTTPLTRIVPELTLAAVTQARPRPPSPRSAGASPAARAVVPAGSVVPPGVYVYATSGHEEVSVMGGSRHDYPAQTTMTVTATACGRDVRWDALQQRWDDIAACTSGPGIDVSAFTTHHEFFGVSDQRTYTCPPGTPIRPAATTTGSQTSGRCTAPGASTTLDTTVAGVDNVMVGATVVPAVRVHVVQVLTGATSGTRTSDIWFALSDGLIVRLLSTVDGRSNSAIGETNYHEQVSLQLTSLAPLR